VKNIFALFLVPLLLALPALASTEGLQTRVRELGPPPRLFASAADWNALRSRILSDPASAAIYRATRGRADAFLAGPVLVHRREGLRRLTSARLFQGRILDLATVARVETDPAVAARYANRARDELKAALALPDWNPDHFLDVAEYALGAAVGLDWLHDFLTAAERDALANALIDRAIRPSFDGTPYSLRWLGGKSNWTQVCHAGLAAAALAVADRDPALAARTLERAIAEQAGPNAVYAPDGVYPEGPMYWAYGTTFEVILISLLEHSLGTDFGLADYPGFLASADYLAHMTAPGGQYFNYADSRDGVPPRPVLHWFAAKRRQPDLATPELSRLDGKDTPFSGVLRQIYERNDALALWWHQPAPASSRPAPLPLAWLGRGENPVVAFRTAWDEPRATYLALKGGSPSTSHAHMDSGSFILESAGVRWAVDTGMQDYESLESAGVRLWDGSQSGDRWNVFRLGPESHNILRFNLARQLVDGMAEFTAFTAEGPAPSATLDLTALYHDHATRVTRQATLLPDGSITLQDDWIAGPKPVEVTFQWLTYADLTIEPRGVILRQSGETLHLRVTASDVVKIETDDLSKPARPSDAPNPGLRRIRILVSTPAGQSGRLSVEAVPGSAVTGNR
jgi:hypothetical protein